MATSQEAGALRDRQVLVRLLAPVAHGAAGEIADRLTARFGSLPAILAADPITRAKFLSRDPAAAEQLDIVREAMVQAALAAVRTETLFPNTLAAADYLMIRLAGERAEQVRALYLDGHHMLIRDECVTRGSVTEVPIYPREILRRALELGATSLIIAHNHPGGDLTASPADIAATQRLREAGLTVEVQLLDHLIVSHRGCRSFLAHGLL